MTLIAQKFIEEAIQQNINSERKLQVLKNAFSTRYKITSLTNQELIQSYKFLLKEKKIERHPTLEKIFKKRKVRSLSGVTVITVLTKAYPCPGKCVFCPTENQMPKSYLSNEPAAMRALLNDFDPCKQVKNRLHALDISGHPTDKIELIVLGGTFSFYPKRYQRDFIRACFNALNGGKKERTLKKAQKINETEKHRVVSLSLETRPDYIDEEEVRHFRELGCTKIQLGVQHLDNEILDYVKRGHHAEESARAIKLCKDAGLKVCVHMMPNLPGSTPEKDLKMFRKLWRSEDFRPDYLKVYPCSVTPFSELEKWWQKGEYKSYSYEILEKLIVDIKKTFPIYVRVDRLVRDIPGESILEGSRVTNLRQEIARKYPDLKCQCIRCREIKNAPVDATKIKFHQMEYNASGGKEYFLSFDHNDKICALLRLRFPSYHYEKNHIHHLENIPFCKQWNEKTLKQKKIINNNKKHFIKELLGAAIIREIHTYGLTLNLGKKEDSASQHLGLGKRLMRKAEDIAKKNGYKKIAVISAIGTREYYRKIGYKIKGTYMVKNLSQ